MGTAPAYGMPGDLATAGAGDDLGDPVGLRLSPGTERRHPLVDVVVPVQDEIGSLRHRHVEQRLPERIDVADAAVTDIGPPGLMPCHERAGLRGVHPWIGQGRLEEARRRAAHPAHRRIVLADARVDHDHDEGMVRVRGEDPRVAPGPIRHRADEGPLPEVRLEPACVSPIVAKGARGVGRIGVVPLVVARHGQHDGVGDGTERGAPGRVERGVLLLPARLVLRVAEEQHGRRVALRV